MKNPIPLLVILLLLWIIGGYYYYNSSSSICCTDCALSLSDGDRATFEATNNVTFSFAGSRPDMPAEARGGLEEVATYLADNTDRQLTLTGLYMQKELEQAQSDVGIARATEIKNFLEYLGAPTNSINTTSVILPVLDFNTDLRTCNGMKYTFSDRIVAPTSGLSFIDGAAYSETTEGNLMFAASNNNYEPLAPDVERAFRKTGEYLRKSPDKAIQITGQYVDTETNNTAFPNLGMARANKIKDLLVSYGVSADQIELVAEKVTADAVTMDGDLQVGMTSYAFMAKTNDRLEEVRNRLQSNRLTLYFNTGAQSLNLSDEERSYFADLIYYLDRVPAAKVATEGHTDNVGSEDVNRRLSRKRAEFVRDYLMTNGIRQNQTNVRFQGPDSPIETNDTPAGRAKNRRVEVYLQK